MADLVRRRAAADRARARAASCSCAEPGEAPALLDFFVSAPGHGADPARARAARRRRGVLRRRRAGLPRRRRRRAASTARRPGCARRTAATRRMPLAELVAPAAAHAREGVEVNAAAGLHLRAARADPRLDARRRARATGAATRRCARATCSRDPELAATLERLGAEGAAPFYTRRHRRGRSRAGGRGRRHADARRPRGLRGDRRASRSASATAGTTSSPTRRRRPAGS